MPIFLYETNQATKTFERLDYDLAKSPDERIVVDEMAKQVDASAEKSTVSTNLISNLNALKVLRKKILFLVDVFTKEKKVQENPEYVRRLNAIVAEVQSIEKVLKGM